MEIDTKVASEESETVLGCLKDALGWMMFVSSILGLFVFFALCNSKEHEALCVTGLVVFLFGVFLSGASDFYAENASKAVSFNQKLKLALEASGLGAAFAFGVFVLIGMLLAAVG